MYFVCFFLSCMNIYNKTNITKTSSWCQERDSDCCVAVSNLEISKTCASVMSGPFLIIFPCTTSLEIPAMSVSHTILSSCLAEYPASSSKSVALVTNCSNISWNSEIIFSVQQLQ